MTIGNTIIIDENYVTNEELLKHEYCHVLQWRKYGFFGFLWRYYSSMFSLWRQYKRATNEQGVPLYYANIPFEVQARNCENS